MVLCDVAITNIDCDVMILTWDIWKEALILLTWGIQRHLLYHQCSNGLCTARMDNYPSNSLQLLAWLLDRIVLTSQYFTILLFILILLLKKHTDGEIDVVHTRCIFLCNALHDIIRTARRTKKVRIMVSRLIALANTRRWFRLETFSTQYY